MITFYEYPLSHVQISLQPSANDMKKMDFLCFASPWDERDYSEMEKQPTYKNWLLEIPDVCKLGMLVFQTVAPELEILRLGVHPDWRRYGLAEFILEQLEIHAKSGNIESLWLEVHATNIAAISLYNKLAYKEIGSRKNYFRNPVGDARLLKKVLKHDS